MLIFKYKYLDIVLIYSNILIIFGVLILYSFCVYVVVCFSEKVVVVDVFKFFF